jgi:hypothetical protein
MNADRLNKWLSLAANFGVIAGIIFLGLELRQNSELMRAQSRTEMSQDTIDLLTMNVNDEKYLDTMTRALAGDELTEVEESQFRRTYYGWMWHWNNLVYLHRVGLYDDDEFSLQIEIIRADINGLPGLTRHWCTLRRRVASPELIEAIEGGSGAGLCEKYEDAAVTY